MENSLLKIVSCYKNTVSNEMILVEGETTKTRQPLHLVLSPTDVIVCLVVDRQTNWIEVTEATQKAYAWLKEFSFISKFQAGADLCNRMEWR